MIKKNHSEQEMQEPSLDPADRAAFRKLAHEALDTALNHVEEARARPVWKAVPDEVKQALAEPLPIEPQGTVRVCQDLARLILPYATGNTHPRFFGWVHGAGTPGGIIAGIMEAAMNSNLGGRDHGAIYVERQIIDWCRQLFDFPPTASGLVVSGTSMATLIALMAARFEKTDYNVRQCGVEPARGRLVGYASAQAHSCIARSFDIMGLGMDALREIPVDEAFTLDIKALRSAIETDLESGNTPFCVIGSAATVNTGSIDNLDAIADVCQDYNLWFHVDGAFGAMLALSDKLKPRIKGIERADSLAFDFHKWMHVQYDAGFVLIADEKAHRGAFALRPDYLTAAPRGLAGGNPWFCEYGPELSRGFRALKIWFQLKEHGIQKIAEKIEDNCRQAAYLARMIEAHPDLELRAPAALNIVCFRYTHPSGSQQEMDDLNAGIVMDLQEQGVAAPSTTKLDGATAIRVNITNHRTTYADLDVFFEAVLKAGRARLTKSIHSV